MVRRYDAGTYRKPEVLPNGFLKADAVLTRTGVFVYRLGDGTTRRELRLPEEVGDPASLASFQMLPVTDDHPAVPVTKDNVTTYARGSIGDTVNFDGTFVSAPVLIAERNLVQKVQSGQKDQVSLGYDCDLEMTPGVHADFGPYDAIQRNIRGNHVAIVELGRAGPAARVRMDAADGVMQPGEDSQPCADDESPEAITAPGSDEKNGSVQPASDNGAARADTATNARRPSMKIRIDGIDYEPEQVPQVLERRDAAQTAKVKQLEEQIATSRADAEKARKDAETAVADTKSKLDKETARADGLKSELDKAEKARTDAADPAKISAMVRARVALETKAARVLGAEFKADSLDEAAINTAILKKLNPELKLDGKSADYVQAAVDFAVERFDRENPSLAELRRAAEGTHADGEQRADIEDAIAKRNARNDARARNYRPALSSRPEPKH